MGALGFSYHRSGEDPLPHLVERGGCPCNPLLRRGCEMDIESALTLVSESYSERPRRP